MSWKSRSCPRVNVPLIILALLAVSASAAWAAKVKVCHVPPGNPSNFHTITINESAVQAHLAHGDIPGSCAEHCDTLCSDDNACTIDACDAAEHCLVDHPPVNCDDSNLCTTDSCNPASGCDSTPKVCQDSALCTVDSCDPLTGQCVFPGVFCPAGQSCDPANGTCAPQDLCAGVVCAPLGECYEQGVCSNGACSYQPKPGGTECSVGLCSGTGVCLFF